MPCISTHCIYDSVWLSERGGKIAAIAAQFIQTYAVIRTCTDKNCVILFSLIDPLTHSLIRCSQEYSFEILKCNIGNFVFCIL